MSRPRADLSPAAKHQTSKTDGPWGVFSRDQLAAGNQVGKVGLVHPRIAKASRCRQPRPVGREVEDGAIVHLLLASGSSPPPIFIYDFPNVISSSAYYVLNIFTRRYNILMRYYPWEYPVIEEWSADRESYDRLCYPNGCSPRQCSPHMCYPHHQCSPKMCSPRNCSPQHCSPRFCYPRRYYETY